MQPFLYTPPDVPLDIIHADDQILVVNKPSGLLSVPGKPEDHKDCLENRLRAAYPEVLLVHRLDMATSGVMVFARTPNAQKSLGRQFEKRLVEKRYIAVVAGNPSAQEGDVDLPLATDWPNRPKQHVDHESGRSAQTHWQVLERRSTSTVMALYPKTGRSHQLRVHMAAIGHPILGDTFYGDVDAAPRLLLHAERLSLIIPGLGTRASFLAPCEFFCDGSLRLGRSRS
ncbi:MAG: RluA family pseudouridine synthase [Pseudomonadota bacterium]